MNRTQRCRTSSGGLIDRDRIWRFRFAGRVYEGHPGDTLASALVANGVRLLGRSFKYHRPRGLLGIGAEEPNVLVQLGEGARSTPNVRATEVPLYDGLIAAPVNCWPNVRFDIGGINDRLARFLSVGFYYKTFMWPSWHLYEGLIRRAAGLGRVSDSPDPDRYEHRYAHCDLLVVGAGPAGLAAARAATRNGRRVILVEQDHALGGSLLSRSATIDGLAQDAWILATEAELRAAPDTRVLTRTVATAYHDHNALTLVEAVGDDRACAADPRLPRYRSWQVRAGEVVLATGAIERPLVFAGNDRPGVMLAGAARGYAARYGARAGDRAIVVTNNDDAYGTVSALEAAGATVAAVVDLRETPPADLSAALRARGVPVIAGGAIVATRGRNGVRAAKVRGSDGPERWIACDLVAMSGGFSPSVHLFSQSGGELRFDETLAAFVPARSVQCERSAGAAAGSFDLDTALAEGHRAGGGEGASPRAPALRHATPPTSAWHAAGEGKAFVDFQNDVSVADIELAARENFRSVEHLKRYTTLGMAPDQGKTANVNALAIMAALTGRSIADTGTTRFRPPYTPVPIGLFAGRARHDLFRPIRTLPAHAIHLAAGALLEDFGGWQRPACYPRRGETRYAAEQREARTVRAGVGLFDGSPLGKIEVIGPDAARFLDRIYANVMSTLKVGRVRYGLMLSELGVVIDDGVAARLGEHHFLLSTTGAGATRIAAWLEEWLQCEWPDLDVVIAPVTTAWGVVTLSGPAARSTLRALGGDIDLSAEAFPHMSFREGEIAGLPARVQRVSYTGELGYEVAVPAGRTADLWEMFLSAGAAHGIAPVGIDAWMLLRMEKGYLHIGADTDGTTTARDVGWEHVLRRKGDFIGKRSLSLPEHARADRRQFVGFELLGGDAILPIGAHVPLEHEGSQGYVTSSGFSPTLGRGVALGMIRRGAARLGEIVTMETPDGKCQARIVTPTAFDPDGVRLHA